MKNILEELYNGRIYPAELITSKQLGYSPLNERLSVSMKGWKQKLSEEDYKQLGTLLDLKDEMSSLEVFEAINHGFKLGALIMFEVMGNIGELTRKEEAGT